MRILELDPVADPVEVKRRVGVVPEDLALFDRLTAAETLSFIGQVHGMPGDVFKARSHDLLTLMDLTGAATTLVADFSHGMRKKLALAAALLPAPKLLFLDEPFEGIDAVASRQIKELLHSFVARGGTIFLTSHILEIVERLSTHIGVIANGRIVAQGRIEDVRSGAHGHGHARGAVHRAGRRRAAGRRSGLAVTSTRRIFRAFLWMRWRVLHQRARADRRARHTATAFRSRPRSSARSSR